MRYMQKIILLLTAIVFISCGTPDDGEKIVFWIPFGSPSNAYLMQIVNEYNATNPVMKVELVQKVYGTYTNELRAAISAGNPPDVVMLDRFTINQWAAEGNLHDLTPYLGLINIYDYQISAWEETKYNNKTYALPFDADVRVLYYNKEIIQDVYNEKSPSTWKPEDLDFINGARTLTKLEEIATDIDKKESGNYTRIGFIPQMDQGNFFTWGLIFGGEFYDSTANEVTPTDQNIIDAFVYLRNWNSGMGIADVQAFLSKYNYMTDPEDYATHPFIKGDLAMTINGDWFMDVLERYAPNLEYGVTFIPVHNTVHPITWTGGYAWAIPAGSNRAQEAMKFLAFGCGYTGQYIYCSKFHKAPTLVNLFDNGNWYNRWGEIRSVLEDVYRIETIRPILPVGAYYWDELTKAQEQIISGSTASTVLFDVKTRVQLELDKFN